MSGSIKKPRIERHRTAIRRPDLSRPLQLAWQQGLLGQRSSVFDYGCGRGDDISRLHQRKVPAEGWDPVYRPDNAKRPADVVNLGYVVNVIEDARERAEALREAWSLAKRLLIVSARLKSDRRGLLPQYQDGYLTGTGTFQKFFGQEELYTWIAASLGEKPVPGALGVFYIFRDDAERERFISSRHWRRQRTPLGRIQALNLFDSNAEQFAELVEFLGERGRIPHEDELAGASALIDTCGSLRRAYKIVERIAGEDLGGQARRLRTEDYQVYIALSRFTGRPRFRQLPVDLQRDVKAYFGSFRRACEVADDLLLSLGQDEVRRQACRASLVGKQTPTALYTHTSALEHLPAGLRVYEGCARVLVGEVEFATIVKLHHVKAAVSYLEYQDFDRDPHPALGRALHVNLTERRERLRDYRDAANPPILHRKEEFVADDYPGREKFARLTRQEERAGLYGEPERIGTRHGWEGVLADNQRTLQGHRLLRA